MNKSKVFDNSTSTFTFSLVIWMTAIQNLYIEANTVWIYYPNGVEHEQFFLKNVMICNYWFSSTLINFPENIPKYFDQLNFKFILTMETELRRLIQRILFEIHYSHKFGRGNHGNVELEGPMMFSFYVNGVKFKSNLKPKFHSQKY